MLGEGDRYICRGESREREGKGREKREREEGEKERIGVPGSWITSDEVAKFT